MSAESRLTSLDLIRGFAVLGILPANLPHFIGPHDNRPLPERVAAASILLLIDTKMITSLAILFGAGLAIQEAASRRRGEADTFPLNYLWRQLLLLGLGLCHGLLLWFGDILTAYAWIGMIALLLVLMGPGWVRGVMIGGLVWTYAALLLIALVVALLGDAVRMPDKKPLGETDGPPVSLLFGEGPLAERFQQYATDENHVRIYRNGSFADRVEHRALFIAVHWVSLPFLMGWYLLACFLLGMQLIWAGVFHGGEARQWYRSVFITLGLGIGVPLHVAAAALTLADPNTVMPHLLNIAGALPQALLYIGLLLWWDEANVLTGLRERYRAVGRMALTNYLMQSVICGLVFYGYGLGLYGRTGLAWACLLIPIIWGLELWWSPIWLHHFKIGPVEWVWRSLAGGRRAVQRSASLAEPEPGSLALVPAIHTAASDGLTDSPPIELPHDPPDEATPDANQRGLP